jgi:hypothetical protein
LQEKFFSQAQALLASLNSIPFPQHDLPIHKHLLRSLTFGHVEEYFQAIRVMAPFFPAPISFNTTSTLTTLHPKSNGYFHFFLEDYEPNQDLKFFFLIPSNWRSNACHICCQLVILGWFLNTFGIIFTLKI